MQMLKENMQPNSFETLPLPFLLLPEELGAVLL
jgi:hypothetical protein